MAANLEKIARMDVIGVPQKEIAGAVGLSEGRISQILDTDEYKVLKAGLTNEAYEKNQSLNEGWDLLEAESLNRLLERLAWSSDPDFVLKAAAVANRANRRGNANQPIDGRLGVRAVIHLKQTFINHLQQVNVGEKGLEGLPQKEINVMSPGDVEKSFTFNENDDLLPAFPEEVMAPAE